MEPMDTFEFIRSVPTQLFVGGRFVPAENNATFPVADPATGKSLTDVADASPADALRALEETVAASPKWATTPAREPGEMLRSTEVRRGGKECVTRLRSLRSPLL